MGIYPRCLPASDVVVLLLGLAVRVKLFPLLCKWSVTGQRVQGTLTHDPAEVWNGATSWTPVIQDFTPVPVSPQHLPSTSLAGNFEVMTLPCLLAFS